MLWDNTFINSVGTYLPERVSIDSLDRYAETEDNPRNSGYISFTRSEIPEYVMAGIAAKRALENSVHRTQPLSPIAYVALTANFEHIAPVCYLQRKLKQPEALAFGMDAASDGGVKGIEVVANILSNDQSVSAGLVSATTRSFSTTDRWLSGSLMGDGAAAVIVSRKEGFAQLIASHRTSIPDLESLFRNKAPHAAHIGAWEVPFAHVGFGPYLETLSHEVFSAVSNTLSLAKISIEEISYFCIPALSRITVQEIYLERCQIPIEKTCWTDVMKNGHVGPCDQLLGLAHLLDTGRLKTGQFIMLLGGGLGWRLSCLLLRIV